MNERPANTFERKTFTTSRLSEFATESELTKQVGYPASLWPLVVVKELVDNALDAAENADLAPDIAVTVEPDRIIVADQGPGIPAATVKALVDFTAKTSSNAAYCSPSRGQQGNALQSILAMPFALSGAEGSVLIEAQGKAHDIKFTLDPVRQIPVIERAVAPSAVKSGTRTTVRWPLSPKVTARARRPRVFTARHQLHLAQSAPQPQGGLARRKLSGLGRLQPRLAEMAPELRHLAALVHARKAHPTGGGGNRPCRG